jgi:AhpD family alkylhydroperoxidase
MHHLAKEKQVNQRIDYYKASKEAVNAMLALDKAVASFGLEPSLVELVKIRASQINGCAFCVDLHTSQARKAGETERRLHALAVWHEAPFFTARERAALAWTESLTRLPDTHAADDDYEQLRAQFSDKEMADLTVAIILVNGWNRLGVGFRRQSAD